MTKKPTFEELEKRVKELEKEAAKNEKAREVSQNQAHALGERIKELNCLYGISVIVDKPGISFDEILQGIINLIPASWQYPEFTCARIILEGKEFRTENFRETTWKQASEISVWGKTIAALEVYYLEERVERDDGPFMKEERVLLTMIAERLGRITERMRGEEERERLFNELVNKNTELEQIVYVTSHDLRSPLVNIQGYSKELEMAIKEIDIVTKSEEVSSGMKGKLDPILREDIPEALRYISISTSKMDSLLLGLLKLSRLGRGRLDSKHVDMNNLMSNVVDSFDFQIRRTGVKIQIEELPFCHGDETHLSQIFSNIVDNALKFFDPKCKATMRIFGYQENQQAIYCIEDNGIGVPSENQKIIFEIFYQLNPNDSAGEGLGLTIVKKLVDRHGGKIWLESESGKGSKFFISIPQAIKPQ